MFFIFGVNSLLMAQTLRWRDMQGPVGGTGRAVAVNSSGHIFVGGSGEVWRSEDNGDSWSKCGKVGNYRSLQFLRCLSKTQTDIFLPDISLGFQVYCNGDSWTLVKDSIRAYVFTINAAGIFLSAQTRGFSVLRITGFMAPD